MVQFWSKPLSLMIYFISCMSYCSTTSWRELGVAMPFSDLWKGYPTLATFKTCELWFPEFPSQPLNLTRLETSFYGVCLFLYFCFVLYFCIRILPSIHRLKWNLKKKSSQLINIHMHTGEDEQTPA